MGGIVKIAVRLPDGKQMANQLFTSSISAFFDNDRFYDCDLFHIRKFMIELDDDNRLLAPAGYGLVVGDYMHKKIYTMQWYTTLALIHSVSLALDSSMTTDIDEDDYLVTKRFIRLYDKGYIPNRTFTNVKNGELSVVKTPLAPLTAQEILVGMVKEYKYNHTSLKYDFHIESDWEIIRYTENVAGYMQFKEDLDKAGFVFSADEVKTWEEEIADKIKQADVYKDDDTSGPYVR